MIFPASMKAWGTPEFESVLADELDCQRHEFNFDDYSRNGWTEDACFEFVVQSFRDTASTIEAECSVDFNDCSPTGCQDMVDRENATAFFTLTISKQTGRRDTIQSTISRRSGKSLHSIKRLLASPRDSLKRSPSSRLRRDR